MRRDPMQIYGFLLRQSGSREQVGHPSCERLVVAWWTSVPFSSSCLVDSKLKAVKVVNNLKPCETLRVSPLDDFPFTPLPAVYVSEHQ